MLWTHLRNRIRHLAGATAERRAGMESPGGRMDRRGGWMDRRADRPEFERPGGPVAPPAARWA